LIEIHFLTGEMRRIGANCGRERQAMKVRIWGEILEETPLTSAEMAGRRNQDIGSNSAAPS
jgi:hypothetical protein